MVRNPVGRPVKGSGGMQDLLQSRTLNDGLGPGKASSITLDLQRAPRWTRDQGWSRAGLPAGSCPCPSGLPILRVTPLHNCFQVIEPLSTFLQGSISCDPALLAASAYSQEASHCSACCCNRPLLQDRNGHSSRGLNKRGRGQPGPVCGMSC